VKQGKHLVTASYVSKEMSALDEEAKKAGVILLNECGLIRALIYERHADH